MLYTVHATNNIDHTVYVKNLDSFWAWLLAVACIKEGRSMGADFYPQVGFRD